MFKKNTKRLEKKCPSLSPSFRHSIIWVLLVAHRKKNVDEQVSLRLSKPSTPVQTSAKSLSEEYLWMTLSCYEKNYDLKNTGKYVRYRRPVRHTVLIVIISKLRWCWIIILPLHFSTFDIRSFIILILSIPLPQTSHNTRVLLNNPSVPSVMIKHPNFSFKKRRKNEKGKRFKFLPLMSNFLSITPLKYKEKKQRFKAKNSESIQWVRAVLFLFIFYFSHFLCSRFSYGWLYFISLHVQWWIYYGFLSGVFAYERMSFVLVKYIQWICQNIFFYWPHLPMHDHHMWLTCI